jgi:hypothetical protein
MLIRLSLRLLEAEKENLLGRTRAVWALRKLTMPAPKWTAWKLLTVVMKVITSVTLTRLGNSLSVPFGKWCRDSCEMMFQLTY